MQKLKKQSISIKRKEYQKKKKELIIQVKEKYGTLECPLCKNKDVSKMYKSDHIKLLETYRTQNLGEWTLSRMQDDVYCCICNCKTN